MLRLQDLYAPKWSVTVNGTRYSMKPLSLATFAELEGDGVSLHQLGGKNSAQQWAKLFYLLSGLHDPDAQQEALLGLMKDPIALKTYQERVVQAINHQEALKEKHLGKNTKGPQIRRPEPRDPRDKDPKQDQRQESAEAEEAIEELDATFLLELTRVTGFSLADLSRMSFRGVMLVLEWVKENPPQPGLGSMMGML